MKKCIGIFVFLTAIFLWLQCGRAPGITGSMRTAYTGGYAESITVVANRLYIPDPEKLAREVIAQYEERSPGETILRGDQGAYPEELHMTVYAGRVARLFGRRSFEACFVREDNGWLLEHISKSGIG